VDLLYYRLCSMSECDFHADETVIGNVIPMLVSLAGCVQLSSLEWYQRDQVEARTVLVTRRRKDHALTSSPRWRFRRRNDSSEVIWVVLPVRDAYVDCPHSDPHRQTFWICGPNLHQHIVAVDWCRSFSSTAVLICVMNVLGTELIVLHSAVKTAAILCQLHCSVASLGSLFLNYHPSVDTESWTDDGSKTASACECRCGSLIEICLLTKF